MKLMLSWDVSRNFETILSREIMTAYHPRKKLMPILLLPTEFSFVKFQKERLT